MSMGHPGVPASRSGRRRFPSAPGSPVVRTLESKISDVAVGGGGRYLLLVLKAARKLAIFDVNAADVVKTIALPTDNVLVAAGARKFVVAYPDEKLLQRWDFEHLTSEGGPRPSPIKGQLEVLAMGSDSDDLILAHWEAGSPMRGPDRFSFIGLESFEVLKVGPTCGTECEVSPSRGTFRLRTARNWELRTAPGGSLIGLCEGSSGNNHLATLSVRNGRLGNYVKPVGYCRVAAPGPDGVTVFTDVLGRLDAFGKPLAGPPDSSLTGARYRSLFGDVLTVPSASPSYFLVLGPAPGSRILTVHGGPASVSIHAAGDGTRLLTVPTLPEMAGYSVEDWNRDRIRIDKRFHFVPDAKLLITIPPSNDRLLLRRVDIDAAVGQVNAIVILSAPLINAVAGVPLRARIEAISSGGNVRFTLVQGPKGLSLSPDGEIAWPAPELPDGMATKVALSLRDASGRIQSHEVLMRLQ